MTQIFTYCILQRNLSESAAWRLVGFCWPQIRFPYTWPNADRAGSTGKCIIWNLELTPSLVACLLNPPHPIALTLIRLGGGPWWPPLDILCDNSATREALATTLDDNFLSSFPHILTPNLWRPGVWFRRYVTFCTCTSDRKRLKMWFCVQNQCK